jgi:hypothetical protein
MGWGAAPETKIRLLGKGAVTYHKKLPKAEHLHVDGNAWFRRHCVGSLTAKHIATTVVKQFNEVDAKFVFVAMDNSAYKPVFRDEVAEQRSKNASKIPKISTTELHKIKSDSPANWQDLFAHKESKLYMLTLLVDEVKKQILASEAHRRSEGLEPRSFTITSPESDEIWHYPWAQNATSVSLCHHLREQPYGEAEAQVIMAMRHCIYGAANRQEPIPKTLVLTIDTDIGYQLGGLWARHAQAVWGKVFQYDTTIYRSKAKAPSQAESMWEILDFNAIQRGCSESTMIWKIFTWLAAGGCDYCKGLGRFGWSPDSLYQWESLRSPFNITQSPSFSVNVRRLAKNMKTTRKSKRGDKAPRGGEKELIHELNRMLYCTAYYVWQDATRAIGGPLFRELICADASRADLTVDAWLQNYRHYERELFVNSTHPPIISLEARCHSSDQEAAEAYRGNI